MTALVTPGAEVAPAPVDSFVGAPIFATIGGVSGPIFDRAMAVNSGGALFYRATLSAALSVMPPDQGAYFMSTKGGETPLLTAREVRDANPGSVAPLLFPILRAFGDGILAAVTPGSLWYADPHRAREVAWTGMGAPGFAEGSILTLPNLAITMIGNARSGVSESRVYFSSGVLAPNDPTPPPTRVGLFSLTRDGVVELLMRTGDTLDTALGARTVLAPGTTGSQPTPSDDPDGRVVRVVGLSEGGSALVLLLVAPPDAARAECAGDLNGDRVIDFSDLLAALSREHVGMTQLNLVLSAFGQSCTD